MSHLLQLQRRMAEAVMRPLARGDRMRRRVAGQSIETQAAKFIKPNDRLTSFERLEIYNRQHWILALDSFAEDFPGLKAVLGTTAFDRLARAYVSQCPSRSYTLSVLGSRLVDWMSANPGLLGARRELALEAAKLEWAHIEAFDAAERPALAMAGEAIGPETCLQLQPYLRLSRFRYAVDDLLLAVQQAEENGGLSAHRRQQLLRDLAPSPIFLAVHRADFSVHYKRLDPVAFRLLRNLQRGAPLGDAMEAAFKGSTVPADKWPVLIQGWFANWTELGWFCA